MNDTSFPPSNGIGNKDRAGCPSPQLLWGVRSQARAIIGRFDADVFRADWKATSIKSQSRPDYV